MKKTKGRMRGILSLVLAMLLTVTMIPAQKVLAEGEAAGNPTDSYFTIKRKKYQVFIRAIFIFFRKIILIFRACRKATQQVNPRLILGFPSGGKLSTKLTDEGAATLTLLKNFKQTDSRPPWLPLWGSCPQSGLKRTPPIFSDFSRKK